MLTHFSYKSNYRFIKNDNYIEFIILNKNTKTNLKARDSDRLWCYVDNENFYEYCNATKCPGNFSLVLMNFR